MAGNVWEWVEDRYAEDYYANSPFENPTGPVDGNYRVLRGGGCTGLPVDLRTAARAKGNPQHWFDGQIGFRCAASDTTTP